MESNLKKTDSRSRIIKGDVFRVTLDNNINRYFQYVADDFEQLNSQVIRVFKFSLAPDEGIDLNELIKDKIDFYAHVFLRIGVKLNYWVKIGHVSETGKVDVYFRGSNDSGKPEIKRSENWYVWRINEPTVKLGKLIGHYREAEIGAVIPPNSIVYRMRNGSYDFVYPGF